MGLEAFSPFLLFPTPKHSLRLSDRDRRERKKLEEKMPTGPRSLERGPFQKLFYSPRFGSPSFPFAKLRAMEGRGAAGRRGRRRRNWQYRLLEGGREEKERSK